MEDLANETRFGLARSIIQNLCTVMKYHPSIEAAVIYGSRGRGNYRSNSDIDIAIYAPDMETLEWMDLSGALKMLSIFKIDTTHVESCLNQELSENIARDGVQFYPEANA